ncbi:MAG: type I-E CRISPR-associated protein Cse1/CasA [Burkholderiales bacterium]|nr:type I-E CRISPR-associated protein Cse1/CasA [Burkholderiales bacterium]
MNLLQDPWMPVRDAQGRREWIAPERLSEPQWRAFDAARPDFNGALAQFAIGLLQTTTTVDTPMGWRELFRTPPNGATLRQWFAPVRNAFELDGDGPRFMQDLDLGSEGVAVNGIGALLIESPGEETLKENRDHFVKRNQVQALCGACAAAALFTLQLNAPTGGAGHLTGLRGGGPLTTLVLAPGDASIWQHLWMNVRERPAFLAQGGSPDLSDPQRSFPWLGPMTALQPDKGKMAQSQVHPAQLYWAMPRRIRLDLTQTTSGPCGICARNSERLVHRYGAKKHGLNYKGEWSHPLTPSHQEDKGRWLPVRPQRGGLGYRHWLAWVLGASSAKSAVRAAPVVTRALELPARTTDGALRLWAFGYDMDNMKARCWHDATLPLFALAECDRDARQQVQAEVARWIETASLAGANLRGAVKDAWFDADARGDFSHIDASFWSGTEAAFYGLLQPLIDSARDGAEHPVLQARQRWHQTLTRTALRLFDEVFVGAGAIERQNPGRIARAHRQLQRNLNGPKLKQTLGLPAEAPAQQEST